MGFIDIIILFFCCVIEVYVLYDYFCNFFELRYREKYTKIICIGTVSTIYLINTLQSNLLNLVLVCLVLWTFSAVVFDAKLGSQTLYFVMAYIVMIGVEFLYIILTNTTTKLLEGTGLILVSEYLWQLLFIKFLNYLVFAVLKQMSKKSKKRMTNKLFLVYLSVPISTLGIMLTVFYSGIDVGSNLILKVLMTLFWCCMIVGNIMLFYAFQKHTENLSVNASQQLELMHHKLELERLTKIADWNDDFNEMIHNMSHTLKVIDQLAYEKKYNEICEVVEGMNGKLNREEVYEYSNHKMLNIILYDYYAKAEGQGVHLDVYVEPGCVLDNIQNADLITMIGNLMDNAILAATQMGNDSAILVRIFMEKNGKLCVIKIVNDFIGEIKHSNGKFVSTKKDKGIHGIGVISVEKTVQKYGGYLECYINEGRFNAVIVFPV